MVAAHRHRWLVHRPRSIRERSSLVRRPTISNPNRVVESGVDGPTANPLQLRDLRELQLNWRFSTEDIDQHLDLELVLVDLLNGA